MHEKSYLIPYKYNPDAFIWLVTSTSDMNTISTMSNNSTTVANENPKPTEKIRCHNRKRQNHPKEWGEHSNTI